MANLVTMRLDQLTFDPAIQPRADGLNEAVVEQYADDLRDGKAKDMPPLVAYATPDGPVLVSQGFHRGEAHRRAGKEEVQVELRDGDRKDALIDACGSNRKHGLQRTNKDKRRAVELVLLAFPEWTDRSAAEAVGVSNKFVGDVRRELIDAGRLVEPETKTGKGGKEYHIAPTAPQARDLPDNTEPEPESEDDASELPSHDLGEPVAAAPPKSPPPAPAPPPPIGTQKPIDALPRDRCGRVIPAPLLKAFAAGQGLADSAASFTRGLNLLTQADATPEVGGFLRTRPHLTTDSRALAAYVRRSLVPYCVCPACIFREQDYKPLPDCPTCGGRGYLTRANYDALPQLLKDDAHAHKPGDSWEGDTPEELELYREALANDAGTVTPSAPGLDAAGQPIPKHLRDVFAADYLNEQARSVEKLGTQLKSAVSWLHWLKPEANKSAAELARFIRDAIPFAVCKGCRGKGCGDCMMAGYIPQYVHQQLELQAQQNREQARQHAKAKPDAPVADKVREQVIALRKQNKSYRDIAAQLKIGEGTVSKIIKDAGLTGQNTGGSEAA